MEKGIDFLKSQVNNAIMQHMAFVDSLESHAKQAKEPRYRELCQKYIPIMKDHHQLLEQFGRSIGAEGGGAVKRAIGGVAEAGKDAVDAMRSDDYLRLVGDIVMARQGEDTFNVFREGGRMLGNEDLHRIGEIGEREHDNFVHEANRLATVLFVEHVGVGAAAGAPRR
jgi:hypothetical protein